MKSYKLTLDERLEKYPPRRFACAYCHDEVFIDNSDMSLPIDKRTRFCSRRCERQWWRRETRHPTHLTNMHKQEAFHDVNKYDE